MPAAASMPSATHRVDEDEGQHDLLSSNVTFLLSDAARLNGIDIWTHSPVCIFTFSK